MTTETVTHDEVPSHEVEAPAPAAGSAAWTARRFFEALGGLSPLRVISISGPSVFESILTLDRFGIADGYLNTITPDYHWHLRLDRFRHLTSKDEVHARSGRRVLFFELREAAERDPFLSIYLYRGKGEDLGAEREEAFAAMHAELAAGRAVEVEL